MQPLDKYVVTNKRSNFYGQEVWVYRTVNENGIAKFSDRKGNILQLKMPSVMFVAPRFPNGQYVTDGEDVFTIVDVHRSNLYYIVSSRGKNFGWMCTRSPRYLSTLKAVVI